MCTNLTENDFWCEVVGSAAQRVRSTANTLRKTEIGDLRTTFNSQQPRFLV